MATPRMKEPIARTRELKRRSQTHGFRLFGVTGAEPDIVFETANGLILRDTDGNEYMDMCSMFHCTSLGYGRRELIEAANEQMNKLTYMVNGALYANIPAIDYSEALAKFTPRNINRFFFCNGGSEATETALKIARAYWYHQGKPTKYKIICLMEGYHGLTSGVTNLLGDYELRAPFGPEVAGIVRIPNYNCYRCPLDRTYPDCGIACARYLERAIDEEGEDSIAAFIAEPMFGYGGGIAPPAEYFPIVSEICTRHNVLLIDDEVMTGFCRTGKNFAVDHWNVQPDLMTMAKGMSGVYFPVAGIGVSDRVFAPLADKIIMSGVTTGGHPVGMAIAKAALDIYIKERIAERVDQMGKHVRERLDKEFMTLPHVGNYTGLGLMYGIEIVADKKTKHRFPLEMDVMHNVVLSKCLEAGLLPRVYSARRHDRIAFAPPLIATQAEIDKELNILHPILAGLRDIKV